MIKPVTDAEALAVALAAGPPPAAFAELGEEGFCEGEIRRLFPEFAGHESLSKWCSYRYRPLVSTPKGEQDGGGCPYVLDASKVLAWRCDIHKARYENLDCRWAGRDRLRNPEPIGFDEPGIRGIWDFLSLGSPLPTGQEKREEGLYALLALWEAFAGERAWCAALAEYASGKGTAGLDAALDAGLGSAVDAYFGGVPVEVLLGR